MTRRIGWFTEKPGLEEEYQELKGRWRAGEQDRDLCLRLMFFAWMHEADPPFVTGLSDDPEAADLWRELFDYFDGEASSDLEFLFAAGIMAELFPWFLSDEEEWSRRGARMKARALEADPELLPERLFEGRGEYGAYFAHQLRGHRPSRGG